MLYVVRVTHCELEVVFYYYLFLSVFRHSVSVSAFVANEGIGTAHNTSVMYAVV